MSVQALDWQMLPPLPQFSWDLLSESLLAGALLKGLWVAHHVRRTPGMTPLSLLGTVWVLHSPDWAS